MQYAQGKSETSALHNIFSIDSSTKTYTVAVIFCASNFGFDVKALKRWNCVFPADETNEVETSENIR